MAIVSPVLLKTEHQLALSPCACAEIADNRIDCLYVEQEVVADDTPAVIAVMKADKAR